MELHQSIKPYHIDHSIVYSCQYHVIFCPKYRRKVLTESVAARLSELVLAKQSEYHYTVIEMDIMLDHVHLVLDVDPREGINKIVGKIKAYTSHELREEFPWLKKRLPTLWTRNKFIATVGTITLDAVQTYIEQQKNV